MAIHGKAFAGDPEDAALLAPWIAPAPLSPKGIPLGLELQTGRVVYFDPWLLKKLRLITGTLFLLLGQRDAGKSTLLNMLIMRLMTRQAGLIRDSFGNVIGVREMTARNVTRKMNADVVELKPITDLLFGNFVDMNRSGFVNIFDHKMKMSEWDKLETAINVVEMANNDVPLCNFQPLALQVGVHKMLTEYSRISSPEVLEIALRSQTAKDKRDYFKSSNAAVLKAFEARRADSPEMYQNLQLMMDRADNVPDHEFLRDSAFCAQMIGRVLRGDFGQVFGGTNSLRDILVDPMTTLNMTGLPHRARQLLEAMLWKWNTVAMANNDQEMIPGINVGDEEHEGATSLMYMRFWAQDSAKARAKRTLDLRATQFLRQLTEAGAEGSEIRALAKQISMGIGGYFIGQQPENDDALADIASLGLGEHDVQFTRQLKFGEFGFKLPNKPVVYFRAIITPMELALSESNQAGESMLEFMDVMSIPEIRERAKNIGFVQLGVNKEMQYA